MNRRGFISLLAGTAGASLAPWRSHVERLIVLPSREITAVGGAGAYAYRWSWESRDGIETLAEGPRVILPAAGSNGLDGLLWLAVTDGSGRTVRHSHRVHAASLRRHALKHLAA